MYFKIKGTIRKIETIAIGHGIKNLNRLNKIYGKANWRKLKGICHVELEDGAVLEAEVHWYEGHGIGKKRNKNQKIFIKEAAMRKHFMICVDNYGYESSLETRKLYEVLTDSVAEKHHQIRVIDESGEDYLYPENFFAPVRLPHVTKEKLELATA